MITPPSLLARARSRKAGQVGQQLILFRADERWKAEVRDIAIPNITRLPPGATVTGEDVRLWALADHIRQPHHPNAWSAVIGSIMRELVKDRVLKRYGFVGASDRAAHGRMLRLYARTDT